MSSEKFISRPDSSKIESVTSTITCTASTHQKRSLDDAYNFLRTHQAENQIRDAVSLRRLRRKIDWRIVPILYCIFGLQFLDKFLLNYSIVMGMPEDLKLKGNDLNNIASSLWIAYLVATVPSGVALNKLPVAKWLGTIMTVWGIIISCVAAVQSYHGLLAVRVLMGLFDASVPPCLMLISSQYYRKDEQATRFAWWFSSVGSAMVLGGLISYGFQSVEHSSLASWRIMYLALGLISICVGIWALLLLPDTPMQARFLTDAEKAAIIQHVSVNETGVHNSELKLDHLVDLMTDPQVYLLASIVLVASCGSGIVSTYSSSLIKGLGYTSKQSTLLNMPVGIITIVFTLGVAYAIRYGVLQRWSVIFICKCFSIVGGSLLAFAPRNNVHTNLAGLYLYGCAVPASGIVYQWTAANIAGHTKRSVAMSLKSAAFAVGQIIAPYAVQQKTAPAYQPAKVTILATQAASAGVVIALALYYLLENRNRNKKFGASQESDVDSETVAANDEAWTNLTDRERKSTFRYVY